MEQLIVSEKTGCTTLLLIDYFVKDYSVLIDSTNANTLPILYSYLCSKETLIETLRVKFTTIDRMGILFTQGNANLFLDKKHFFVEENVEFMKSLILEFNVTHIDFLACETLLYLPWTNYYDRLKETGVIIGASSNKTGNRRILSDWKMENSGENIELVYFTNEVEMYKDLLDEDSKIDEDDIEEMT